MSTQTSVRVEGGLLSPDFFDTLTERAGQRPTEFGILGSRTVLDEATAAWGDARNYWLGFQSRVTRRTNESPVTVTREQWVIPLLEALGYALSFQRRAAVLDGRAYSISHRAGEDEDAPPVHIVGHDEELGSRNPSRSSQMAPHALLQDYLNRSDHLWGLVTNGRVLRLLRDSTSFTRPAYIEFDLETMFTSGQVDAFLLLYRLAHRTRLPGSTADAHQCLLERYHQEAIEEGGRIRDGLRAAVEHAIRTFANGFLAHPRNDALREAVASGRLRSEGYYQQLLYLIYRLLFLMVAEERDLLRTGKDGDAGALAIYRRYQDHMSLGRLRALAEQPLSAPERFDDLYLGLRALFQVLREPRLCAPLGLAPLNGELFSHLDPLDSCYLSNRELLTAVEALSYFSPEGESHRRRVNYGALDVEELGSVYESLLDLQPVLERAGAGWAFDFVVGTERKSTGSYYTRPELVRELVESALVPVMEARLAETDGSPEAQQEALCALNVCDPACGSGHFLLAAARRIGVQLARVRTGEQEPSPEEVREGVRDAITHCVYGVDRNPLAVDLCKVALWIEGYARGKPLTFLDCRIRCGDSLVGVFDLEALRVGIPDEAYSAVSGDDKKAARAARDRNRQEREGGQGSLFEGRVADAGAILQARRRLLDMPEDTPEQVRAKRQQAETLRNSPDWLRLQGACNLWAAAFFAPLGPRNGMAVPTTASVRQYLSRGACYPEQETLMLTLAARLRFFHWPLEFPEVLEERGGFDVVLGNPPWERIKLQEQEFFSGKDRLIAQAPNSAARGRLIARLPTSNPALWEEYSQALHDADALSVFLRGGGRFPLAARGDINTYAVFAELARALVGPRGRAGVIVPTGIATDNTTKDLFGDLVETGQLASLYDFENREALFPGVHRSYKFSLLTLAGRDGARADGEREMRFAFFLTDPRQLADGERTFALTREDFRRINPNTRTCPIFRTRADAELTRRIYRRVPVLVNEETGENPWGVSFLRMFDMSNDSHLFRTREELEGRGYRLAGNRLVRAESVYLPLYEAKMVWQFDHRYSSYEGVDSRTSTHLPETSEAQHADPGYQVLPWYWVARGDVEAQLSEWQGGWLLGFRDITNATNERTAIFGLVPLVAVGHTCPLVFGENASTTLRLCLLANTNSLVTDYCARQKLSGTHLTYHYLMQLSVLHPDAYGAAAVQHIVPRALELSYTAWDLKPFADDVWAEADGGLRATIMAQHENCAGAPRGAATGGHGWESAPRGVDRSVGLPPFRWDADRRAVLRAELDAYYARLYGLTERDLRYILDPQDVYGPDFPGETFRVLKEKEIREYGEYRTKRLVLEAWERLEG